ncbi:MAG: MFS transporter [Alphaproteobacteria bacterium]|nr:MFS transporter [Alphaproteobacteria bacterium]
MSAPASRERNALGGEAASPLGQYAWAMFDWANQPYFTIVASLIFAPYLATTFVGEASRGQTILSLAYGTVGLVAALASPVAGAIADASGARKPWMLALSVVFFLAACGHWFAVPGAEDRILPVMASFVVANIALEMTVVFNNAMLPTIAPASRLGTLSGIGYGIGYVGGLAALVLVLLAFSLPADGVLPWKPIFGLDPAAYEHVRIIPPLSVVWYAVFVAPLFLFTPDVPAIRTTIGKAVREGAARLLATGRKLNRYGNVARFLIARMIFTEGLNAIFVFGPVYAAGLFGWKASTLNIFGLVVLVFWALGAFVGGILDDRLGAKPTLYLAVGALIAGALLGVSLDRDAVFFFIPAQAVDAARPLASPPEWLYLLAGVVMGLGAGPAQSATRSLMGRLAPAEMMTEFYGLYALSGKAASWVLPLVIAGLTSLTGSLRASFVAILCALVIGLVALVPVRVERASAA